jgi:hypothetical protein
VKKYSNLYILTQKIKVYAAHFIIIIWTWQEMMVWMSMELIAAPWMSSDGIWAQKLGKLQLIFATSQQ